ncbi:hypothetical protein QM437_05375 [Legionella pneumophila]|uniref:hypothetical protein n=1 Tax=Legionella pneumophila TaxID=446 RepID=UPI0024B7A5E6|nr:hypothetical protein [Legionella pneumophila]MDI9824466.1 hypothetical protein [Legionella pneumophila]
MDLLSKLEHAVGNEYLSNQNELVIKINKETQRQADSNKIVSLQPDSNKIVNFKKVNA